MSHQNITKNYEFWEEVIVAKLIENCSQKNYLEKQKAGSHEKKLFLGKIKGGNYQKMKNLAGKDYFENEKKRKNNMSIVTLRIENIDKLNKQFVTLRIENINLAEFSETVSFKQGLGFNYL